MKALYAVMLATLSLSTASVSYSTTIYNGEIDISKCQSAKSDKVNRCYSGYKGRFKVSVELGDVETLMQGNVKNSAYEGGDVDDSRFKTVDCQFTYSFAQIPVKLTMTDLKTGEVKVKEASAVALATVRGPSLPFYSSSFDDCVEPGTGAVANQEVFVSVPDSIGVRIPNPGSDDIKVRVEINEAPTVGNLSTGLQPQLTHVSTPQSLKVTWSAYAAFMNGVDMIGDEINTYRSSSGHSILTAK